MTRQADGKTRFYVGEVWGLQIGGATRAHYTLQGRVVAHREAPAVGGAATVLPPPQP